MVLPPRITFNHDGQQIGIDLSLRDSSSLLRLLIPYVNRAPEVQKGASEIAKVRRWARDNGHVVGDRGRISRKVVDAYNVAVGAEAVDRSGRQGAAVTTIEAIERLKVSANRVRPHAITSTIVVVDAHGVEHPYSPDLFRRTTGLRP